MYPDPAFVIVPLKPGIVKSAVATTVGFPPVNETLLYVPAVYPDPLDVIFPSID